MVESVRYDSWSYKTLEVLSDRKVHKVSNILKQSGMCDIPKCGYDDRPNFFFSNAVMPRLRAGNLIINVKYGHYKITAKGLRAYKNPLVG